MKLVAWQTWQPEHYHRKWMSNNTTATRGREIERKVSKVCSACSYGIAWKCGTLLKWHDFNSFRLIQQFTWYSLSLDLFISLHLFISDSFFLLYSCGFTLFLPILNLNVLLSALHITITQTQTHTNTHFTMWNVRDWFFVETKRHRSLQSHRNWK